ncbi:MAG: hypothetical protein IJ194_05765 [Bacilli bacterium]|nr:hypothetical protein [Bacilli bacterium]
MIRHIVIKFLFFIANMSKKASAIYIILLSVVYAIALSLLLVGLIYIDPYHQGEIAPFALPLTIFGIVFLFIVTLGVALTAISSNYVKRNPHKDPKKTKDE